MDQRLANKEETKSEYKECNKLITKLCPTYRYSVNIGRVSNQKKNNLSQPGSFNLCLLFVSLSLSVSVYLSVCSSAGLVRSSVRESICLSVCLSVCSFAHFECSSQSRFSDKPHDDLNWTLRIALAAYIAD